MSDPYSMTPPASPGPAVDDDDMYDHDSPLFPHEEGSEILPNRPPSPSCFHCQGEVFPRRGLKLYHNVTFHEKGLLKTAVLDRTFTPDFIAHQESTVVLFGYTFPFMALGDRMEKLFRFARQVIGEIQNSTDRDSTHSVLAKRQEVVNFLEYVKVYSLTCMPEAENERRKFLHSVVRHLHLLLVHCGRISEEASVTRYSLSQLGSVHHNFHLRLELTWYILTVFHTLCTAAFATELPLDVKLCQTPGSEDELKSAFDQLVSVLLHDLITLAVPVFEKLSPQEWLLTSPFSCGCVMELWTLLIHLLQYRKDHLDTESFWVQLHQIFQTLDGSLAEDMMEVEEYDSDVFLLNITPAPSKPQAFSLWLTTHLAHLFTFDAHGSLMSPDPSQSCFFAVQMTIDKLIKTPMKEDAWRACLRCCLSMASLWSLPNQLLTVLWEHFARKLNDRFQIHTASIEGLAVINRSSSSLLEKCKKWCSNDETGLEQASSFHLFLRLLAQLLSSGNAGGEWRHIKGRFFSKFHQRRMQELTEVGLHNMTCLFVTVALCVDPEEVARKLLALYDMVDPTSAYSRLRAQVWCGALAVTQLLVGQKKDFAFLAEKLATSFNALARQLSTEKMDHSRKQELTPLITLYVDGVRDVVEQSHLDGAEHLFLDEGISLVLRNCSESQMRHVLTALDSIIMRLRCLVSNQKQVQPCLKENTIASYVAFADRLWLHIFPFVCSHAATLTPPLCLADLAVSFTHLALDFPAPLGISSGGAVRVARHFVVSESTHTSFVVHYLNQILADAALRNTIISTQQSHITTAASFSSSSASLTQTDIVKCWWKCLLLMPSSSASLAKFTQHVMSLPEVNELLGSQQSEDEFECGTVGWKLLLRTIGSAFSKSQGLLDKQRLREKVMPYFMDTAQNVAPMVRACSPLESLQSTYRVVGCLVKYCAPVIYLQSKSCPLPEIIKMMILPSAVFHTDRPLNSNFLSAVRETLHMVLEGLGQLDYTRDSYIQRQIKSIITQYTPRFPLGIELYTHPVLRILGKLPHEKNLVNTAFLTFLAGVVVENLQKNGSSNAQEAVLTLQRHFSLKHMPFQY